MLKSFILLTLCIVICSCQQIYSTVTDSNVTVDNITPSFRGGSKFAYTQETTVRAASAIPSPTTTSSYGPKYSDVSQLLGNLSTTSWGNWYPNGTIPTPTSGADGKYGLKSWSHKWEEVGVKDKFTRGIFSTTVSPTPVPTEELVLPPSDPFQFDTGNLTFPDGFVFGVAGSAAQIEGAVADEGRTPCLLDIVYKLNADMETNFITNENYYLYKQDIARLAAMGVKYYSFSIPWSRILPFTFPDTPVNQQAIEHYDDLINTVLDYGMLPIVTLTHFDTPLDLIDFGSLIAPKFNHTPINAGYDGDKFVDAFTNYGKIVLSHFADRVPFWVGFNEPYMYAGNAVGVKNVILCQAKLHEFYHHELNATGKFGIKLANNFGVPADPLNSTHVEAADRFNDFALKTFGNPLFKGYDYPDSWIEAMEATGSDKFRLSEDEIKNQIAKHCDFLGIDPYTVTVIEPVPEGIANCATDTDNSDWPACVTQGQTDKFGWKVGYRSQSYVYITPTYLRSFLNYLWDSFETPIIISEFGFPVWREAEKEWSDQLFDSPRSTYYQSYLTAVLEAIHYDHINVFGALAWSFADNWEFGDYSQQFGIQAVNRTSQQRSYKKSFFDMVDFVRQRSHDYNVMYPEYVWQD